MIKPKIAFVLSAPSALRAFLQDHIKALSDDYEITVYCNFSQDPCHGLFDDTITLVHIPFSRKIKLSTDIKTLFTLLWHLRQGKYAAAHSMLPKTGLLAMPSAFLARIPIRIHLFTGQVWAYKTGTLPKILKFMDKVTATFSTHLMCDSQSQRQFLKDENITNYTRVLGNGSVCGVNIDVFKPDHGTKKKTHEQLEIPKDAFVFGFMGRLNYDKGVMDMVTAFKRANFSENHYLVIVGPDEEGLQQEIETKYPEILHRLKFVGSTDVPHVYFNAFDVLCLPSYREGFGSVVIEAAACGCPALASKIYGLTDAIEDNETGILHTPGNITEITNNMRKLSEKPDLRKLLADNARRRVVEKFSSEYLIDEMKSFYREIF